jgi:hypothetical protein
VSSDQIFEAGAVSWLDPNEAIEGLDDQFGLLAVMKHRWPV